MNDNLFAVLRARVLDSLQAVVPELPAEVAARVEVTPAREAAHGDMATNAALVASKAARRKPAEIAAALVQHLSAEPLVAEAAAAGPGFVNLRLARSAWLAQLPAILRAGESYGDSAAG
ncbi:MAG TPA: arginine--tRNA ligase, partial [Acetobacteraceae bacterium]